MEKTAHKRNVKLGAIANKLKRITVYPVDINEAAIDNNLSDYMCLLGSGCSGEFLTNYGKKQSIMHPVYV